jgi:alanyl-tRNA synthetase
MTPKKLTGAEIRQTFIDFFVEHGHTAVPSASLVPGGDSTLLFTNSGMVQFKDVFLGTDKRPYTRAVDSQKCMRVAGKHNDLEDVGRDGTHHTFFEMLGNWSFGDYYKKEAIQWAWQLLTDVWGLDKSRLYTTVFKDDKGDIPPTKKPPATGNSNPVTTRPICSTWDARTISGKWPRPDPADPAPRSITTCAPAKARSMKPCSIAIASSNCGTWSSSSTTVSTPSKLEPLPSKHVDTGMGFERIVSVLQGVDSNYKTDLFASSLEVLRGLTGHSEEEMYANFTPYRVICDHARSAAFLIADGVVPGNVGRNYVCRMIIRRAARFGPSSA